MAQSNRIEIVHPVQANAVFASMPDALAAKLRKNGVEFYSWGVASPGHTLARLMLSFATPDDDIARLIALVRAS